MVRKASALAYVSAPDRPDSGPGSLRRVSAPAPRPGRRFDYQNRLVRTGKDLAVAMYRHSDHGSHECHVGGSGVEL